MAENLCQSQSKEDIACKICSPESQAKPVSHRLKKQSQQAQSTSPVSTMCQAQSEKDIACKNCSQEIATKNCF
jgi:hypothetical protein